MERKIEVCINNLKDHKQSLCLWDFLIMALGDNYVPLKTVMMKVVYSVNMKSCLWHRSTPYHSISHLQNSLKLWRNLAFDLFPFQQISHNHLNSNLIYQKLIYICINHNHVSLYLLAGIEQFAKSFHLEFDSQ